MAKASAKRIFLSGCGGGYDVFGCLPHYLKMRSLPDHEVTLINYTFTDRELLRKRATQLATILFRVDPVSTASWLTTQVYFPEQRLANELHVPVYAILANYVDTRIELVVEAYRHLIAGRTIDELMLVDCGSDALLTGNESRLGTPDEDMSHARAVQLLSPEEVREKYLAVIGTNIDVGHGVLQADIDARLTSLAPSAVFTWPWDAKHDENVRRYAEIVSRCQPAQSIVHSLVCAALEGHRGYYLPEHLRSRIHQSRVSLTDQTCVFTNYRFDDVMRDNVYLHRLAPSMNLEQVHQTIQRRNHD